MKLRIGLLFRLLSGGLLLAAFAGVVVAMPQVTQWWKAKKDQAHAPHEPAVAVKLDGPMTLAVPQEISDSLKAKTTLVKQASQPRTLPPMLAMLAYDSNRMARVHARFAGEIVELGTLPDHDRLQATLQPTQFRPIRYGDRVAQGQLLAVLWSKDLGEKKSELVESVSKLRLDEDKLQRLKAVFDKGVIPEANLLDAERAVESDRIALARAERTLRSWRVTETEIEALHAEARAIRDLNKLREPALQQSWARVEVRAPLDGTILEKNIAKGDLVDTTTDLFKIVDLSQLQVWAHAYEEDLPILQKLPLPMPWEIHLKSEPNGKPLTGMIQRIGEVIDPNQHTAMVIGQVDNSRGELKVGQLVTATIQVPPGPDELEIPTTALVEDGNDSIVIVRDAARPDRFELRRVQVVRRFTDTVVLKGRGSQVREGDAVITSGAVELKSAWEQLRGS